MAKNDIHARIAPELMDVLKLICSDKNCNLSDVTRAALSLYVDAYNCDWLFERHKLAKNENSLSISLIEGWEEATTTTPSLQGDIESDNIIDW